MVQYSTPVNQAFSALSHPVRRGILERMVRSDASMTELALEFELTLSGIRKHVHVLERAGLVLTEKRGRVRTCRAGPRRLVDEKTWIAKFQAQLEERFG